MKVYFDVMTHLLAFCVRESHSTDEDTKSQVNRLLVEVLSSAESPGVLSYSMNALRRKSVSESIGSLFFSAFNEVLKMGSEQIQTFAIDFIFWLLEVAKEDSQLDMYSLKSGICSNFFCLYLLKRMDAGQQSDLLIRAIKITEMMTDHREFFTFLVKNKGLEKLLQLLETTQSQEVELLLFGYFLKGFKVEIFNFPSISKRFIDLILNSIE